MGDDEPQAHWERYGEALQRGDAPAALRHLDDVLGLDADSIAALGCKGTLLGQLGRFEDALACFDRIVELEPERGAAHYSRGLQLQSLGRVDEAIEAYSRAVDVDPDDPDPFINRGRLLDDTGDTEAAIEDYDRALALDDTEEIAWANRGNSLAALEKFEEALASFDRALALAPASVAAKLGRSNALMSMGRLEEANAARPVGTTYDQGEVVEIRKPLSDGDDLVLCYYPRRHNQPELLADVARALLHHVAAFEQKGRGLEDGVRIAYGWSVLTIRRRGRDRVLCEPCFHRHPEHELRYDVTFTLQALVMTHLLHELVDAPPYDCRLSDYIAVEPGALDRPRVWLRRAHAAGDGVSGWTVRAETDGAPSVSGPDDDYEVLLTALLATRRPHLIKVLSLPPGFSVVFDGHAVVSIRDTEGQERWGSAPAADP